MVLNTIGDDPLGERFQVVESILSDYGIKDVAGTIKSMPVLLFFMGPELANLPGPEDRLREQHEARKRQARRIELLRELCNDTFESSIGGDGISIIDEIMQDKGCSDWDAYFIYKDMQDTLGWLLKIEQSAMERLDDLPPIPNRRPSKGKNDVAAQIFSLLVDLGLKPWRACRAIADMYIALGVDDRPRGRIQRSLYDKLNRL